MNWTGKIIGVLFGLLTKKWQMVLFGLALGHLYDMGLFNRRPPPREAAPKPTRVGDPYAVLGVSPSASEAEIEQAYRRMISEYHPDRVSNAAKEIRALAEKRAREINSAYEEIKRLRSRGK